MQLQQQLQQQLLPQLPYPHLAHLKLTQQLPSVEEKLRVLDAALVAFEQHILCLAEVSRLNKIIQGHAKLMVRFI